MFKYDYFGFHVIVRAGEVITGKDFKNYLAECDKELSKALNLQSEYRLLNNKL